MADQNNVRITSSGAARTGPLGTALPTDLEEAYHPLMKELGWLSEDGVLETPNIEYSEIIGVGGVTLRKYVSKDEVVITVTIMERNGPVWDLFYPGSERTTIGGVTTLRRKKTVADRRTFAFDVWDGNDVHERLLVEIGEVSERAEVSHNSKGAEQYTFGITCYPNAQGEVFRKVTDDPAVVTDEDEVSDS